MRSWFKEDKFTKSIKSNSLRRALNLPLLEEVSTERKVIKSVKNLPQVETTAITVVEPPVREITSRDVGEALLEMRDLLKEQESQGEVYTRDLVLSGDRKEIEFRHPVTGELVSLVTATIYNDGASTGYFIVNYPGSTVITLNSGESISLDFTKSRKKIQRLFYYTAAGGSAVARLVGKF